MKYNWTLVTINVPRDEALQKKIREHMTMLEGHLKGYPANAVHLHIELSRDPGKEAYRASLTLRVPDNILRSSESSDEVMKSIHLAFSALLHDLIQWKKTLRSDRLWRGHENKGELKGDGFAAEPQADGAGPRTHEDVVRDFFNLHYNQLLRHARRDIHYAELTGEIPANAIDPREVVDEVASKVLSKTVERPKGRRLSAWLYHLIHQEIKRQRQLLKEKAADLSTEKRTKLPDQKEENLHPLEQFVEVELEPQAIRIEDTIPNSEAVPPDELMAQKEALETLQRDIKKWPRTEREVFSLHYLDGFEPEEIAFITQQPIQEVRKILALVQERLRKELLPSEAHA